jgi:hypothetical protein
VKPVNLNKARKAKARAEKTARADANAVKFGRTKNQRQADKARNAREETLLDQHKIGEDHTPE